MTVLTVKQLGPAQGTRDEEGHREYRVPYQVYVDSYADGPAVVLQAPGLPVPGNYYALGNDSDPYAWCRWGPTQVKCLGENEEKHIVWRVDVPFGSKPADLKRCMDQQISDPILEPPKISFSFSKYTEEATEDRFGNKILTSSHEQIRGPQNEWDNSRPQIKIEQNFPTFAAMQLAFLARDAVNSLPIWGFGTRMVKLSNVSGSREFHGFCSVYYKRMLDFDIDPRSWDRDLLDEGSKALRGRWNPQNGKWEDKKVGLPPNQRDPDPNNPADFERFFDRSDEPCRVILDGNGRPFIPPVQETIETCAACNGKALQEFQAYGFEALFQGPVILKTMSFTGGGFGGCQYRTDAGSLVPQPGLWGNLVTPWIAVLDGPVPNSPIVNGATNANWTLVFTADENIGGGIIVNRNIRYEATPLGGALTVGPGIAEVTGEFNCMGSNYMKLTKFGDNSGGAPIPKPSVLVAAVDTPERKPGNIHVEKYDEFNFILLGLPLTL